MTMTLSIDDDLLQELKDRADREHVPVEQVVNRAIRQGLEVPLPARQRFRQQTHAMGVPQVNLDKALSVAAQLEDEELIRKMAQGR